MKHKLKTRLLSLLLCFSMVISVLAHVTPVYSADETETTTEETQNTLEANVGKQAIFDWWSDFLLIDEETLMNSTSDALYDYYYADANWVSYDDIPADDLILKIIDYFYDEENGDHWYKVGARDGETLPEVLQEKPWVYYANDTDFEEDIDPYLVVYDKNDTICFVSASINGTDDVRFVLSSASEALTDATIEITDYDGDYTVSSLAYIYEGNVAWSNAHQVQITKANGEAWSSTDGNVGIRYTSANVAGDTYGDDISYAAAFLYVDETIYSAAVTDKGGNVVSDIVYTNAGSSVIVYEFLDPSFDRVNETGYFTNDAVTLYDNSLVNSKDSLAAELPTTFTVGYSFTDANATEWYWLVSDELIGSPYFLVEAECVTLGELPEAFGDGRVSIADEDGNAVSAITLPIYEKLEFAAVSSLSQHTAGVSYQWQIEYEDGKWVDIYGEDDKTIQLTFSMVAGLLDADNAVNIRCETKSATFTAYSPVIPVTLDLYQPEEPDVVVSESVITSNGETVTVTVAGDIPEDVSVALEETDSDGVNVAYGETVVASLDISIKNADGTEWQPESGETVTVTLEASSLGLNEGDTFSVYHLHNDEVKDLGTYTVVNDTVTFEVDGFSKFVFALVVEEQNFDECIGLYAALNALNEWTYEGVFDYFWLKSDPADEEENTYEWSIYDEDFEIDLVVKIVGYHIDSEGALWFNVEAVNGLELPASLKERPWIHMNNVEQYDSEYDALYLFEPEDLSGEDIVVLDKYGLSVWDLYLYSDETKEITVQTNLTGDVKYRWEVCYDTTEYLWVAIEGETSPSLTLTYAKLAGILNDGEWAALRCVAYNAAESVTSNVIIANVLVTESVTYSTTQPQVIVVSTSSELTSLFEPASDTIMAYNVAPIAEDETPTSVLVTVQFVMGNNTAPIENGLFTYNAPYNGSVVDNITIPTVQGYAAYLEDDRTTPVTGIYALNETNVTEAKTITFRFWPADVSYKVVYMQQNILDDGYTVVREDDLVGLTGSDPDVADVYYEGFVQVWCDTDVIASDGSTVIEVKYDRLYYKMLFDLDGGYGVQPVYARYGTPVSVINPTKAGYIFMGWNAINGPKSDGDDTTVDIPVFTDIPIPAMHTNYKALWETADTAKVTVIIWGQNADDDEYSYMADASKDLSFQAKPGTTVTYNPSGGYVCGLEEHTHGTDCSATCGEEEHEHSVEGSCYNKTCDLDEHTIHTESCYSCGGLDAHTIECYSSSTGTINSTPEEDPGRLTTLRGMDEDDTTDGGLYRIGGKKNRQYYFKLGDDFYQVIGEGVDGNTTVNVNDDTCYCKHIEHDDSCVLTCTVHEHTIEDCYKLTCTDTVHTHTASCYSCGKVAHTHGSGCTLTINTMDSDLWTFSHADTVTVAADGSTTLNVYYVRKTFTLTFRDNGTIYTINERWGTNISEHWPIVGTNGTTYDNGERWSPSGSSTFNQVLVYIDIMPAESFTLNVSRVDYDTFIMHYLVEALPGATNTVTYNGKSFVEYKVIYANYNYVTKAEDFISLKGFETWASNPSFGNGTQVDIDGGGDVYFYYTRNSYNLVFNNYGTTEKTESVQYEAPLSAYGSYILDDSLAPDVYQPGSVTFKGWYLAPQTPNDFNFENAESFDFANSTMPAGDMILYAWWQPVSHTVTFYYDYAALEACTIYTEDGEEKQFSVPHGSKIQDPYIPPKDPTSSYYSFVGWAYRDANGTEILWDFDNSTVTGDVQLYGKWNSTTPADYTVRFVTVIDDKEVEIAEPITGSALGGSTKTFNAKVNEDLYEGYQDRYYPQVMSHTITINLEDTSKNTFTFYYDYVEYTSYTVKYLDKETGKPMSEIDSSYPSERTVGNNTHAMVTETFVAIPGYLPDAYQKVCYIDPDGTNEIIFYYTQDDKNGLWTVHFHLENLDGSYTEAVDMLFTGTAAIGSTVTAPTDTEIEKYYYYGAHTGNVSTGTVSIDEVTHLHMYYNRTVHDYTVKYLEAGTNKVLADEKVVENLKWGTLITEDAIDITNYQVYGQATQSLEISVDETENVITFYYTEKRVTINYVAVGPDGATDFGTVTPGSESLAIISGVASGSVATASSNVYKFVGWYSDAACTNKVGDSATYVPTKADGTLWVDGTTYYAKFEYNLTSLTIKKSGYTGNETIDPNQTFIFNVKGEKDGIDLTVTIHGDGEITIEGLTVGNTYTVTELTEWSWRYSCKSWTFTTDGADAKTEADNSGSIVLGATGNVITFENDRSQQYWLDGDSYKVNLFDGQDDTSN